MTNVEILKSLQTLTKADFLDMLSALGPCDGSIEIVHHIAKARNLLTESLCQQCFDQTHTHTHDF